MTGLVGGGRAKKSAPRIETYGTLDELSSAIGVARAELNGMAEPAAAEIDAWLAWTQDRLFDLGSELATLPKDRREGRPSPGNSDVEALERAIDASTRELPPLTNFIHPGGTPAGAQLHFARTVCRRAERLLVALLDTEEIGVPHALPFLNRLSDALFVWARRINHAAGMPDHIWNPAGKAPGSR